MRRTIALAALVTLATAGCIGGTTQNDPQNVDGGDALTDTGSMADTGTTGDSGTSDDTTGGDDTGQPPSDTGGDTATDTGNGGDDTGTQDTSTADTQNPNLCGGRQCGTNAMCQNDTCQCADGYTGDPYTKCVEEMNQGCGGQSSCSGKAMCVDGNCTCPPGFTPGGSGGCMRPTVGDPAMRSKNQVCQRWKKSQGSLTRDLWAQMPSDECDPGVLKDKVQWEALQKTNVYRWLVGLDPVWAKPSYVETNQHCATTLAADGSGLSHDIDMDYKCYTQKAASGAGSSNIARGHRHPASTVGSYIGDRGNPNLGHRRWIFNPGMGATGFGHRGSYGCMYAFDMSGSDTQTEIYYPAPGPFPDRALRGPWSYLSKSYSAQNPKVKITEVQSGKKLSASSLRTLQSSYGRVRGISWQVPDATTGVEYEVTISGLGRSGNKKRTYKTTLVSCQ